MVFVFHNQAFTLDMPYSVCCNTVFLAGKQ